jgi:predicted RNA-binding protein YlqC (UPF0109 family)
VSEAQADLAKVVEVVGRVLADEPELVRVVASDHRGTTLLELYMAPGDLGRAIGRQGRTAAAIRTLVTSAAERVGRRVQLEFRDGEPPQQQ